MPDHRNEEEATLAVVEEQLQVRHEQVETGRALRVRKQVHDEPVEVAQQLTHETVETKRVPVGRVVDAPVAVRQEGEVTIVPVMAERVVTRTELVIVEEIHIRRRSETREDRAQVNLRREGVVIERFDPETQEWRREEES